jgi:hypothetical protein
VSKRLFGLGSAETNRARLKSGDLAGMRAAKAERTRELQLRYDERLENVSENSHLESHEIYCIS